MDSRGGCCIARSYGGGYGVSNIDRIMMKFRPIAPKPANGSCVSPRSSPEMSETSPRSGRGKRRFNRRCNSGGNNRKRKAIIEEKTNAAVTLPLLPETPTPMKETAAVDVISPTEMKNSAPVWLSFGSDEVDRTVEIIGSCVRVERVMDTWVDVDGLGRTDVERMVNLERDKCPGFVSDGYGRVTWTNEAYRKMVREDGGVEVVVWLAMEDKAAVTAALAGNTAFTCRVRVQNQKTNGKEKSSAITLPCDVWRMDGGGFAWRLDVAAALCLGRR